MTRKYAAANADQKQQQQQQRKTTSTTDHAVQTDTAENIDITRKQCYFVFLFLIYFLSIYTRVNFSGFYTLKAFILESTIKYIDTSYNLIKQLVLVILYLFLNSPYPLPFSMSMF